MFQKILFSQPFDHSAIQLFSNQQSFVLLFFRYLLFYLRSGNAHHIHSPFVFQLYTQVIRNLRPYYVYELLEESRAELLASTEIVEVYDLGAGSKKLSSHTRKVRDIARYSEKSPALAQLLFRLVNHFQPQTIFDLGTCLGTTTLYLAHAHQKAALYTFEGDPTLAATAQQRFEKYKLTHIIPVIGNLDETLDATLEKINRLDFAFFDANHRLEPTLRYFEQCLTKAHENSIFVLDDIYWSAEMMQAWEKIKNHSSVTLTIDLFHLGLVFFRTQQPKQHFRLRL